MLEKLRQEGAYQSLMRHREEKEDRQFRNMEKVDIARLDTMLTAHRKIKMKVD